MASQDYLIAIALIEQNLVRAMPLGGKEIKDNLEELENFKKLGEISNAAFTEILSSADFAIISLKHFQFSGIIKPGHDK